MMQFTCSIIHNILKLFCSVMRNKSYLRAIKMQVKQEKCELCILTIGYTLILNGLYIVAITKLIVLKIGGLWMEKLELKSENKFMKIVNIGEF